MIEESKAHLIGKNLIASFLMSREFDELCNDRVFHPQRFRKNHRKLLDAFDRKLKEALIRSKER